jgi:lipopolysaccharide export LptBFGC system permease protein LptF
MAEHGSTGTHSHGYEEHAKTYDAFIKGSIALTILCFYVLVALVAFAFVASSTNLLVGFGGLVIGTLALIIDLRVGGSWKLSVGWLVIFGLLTAVLLA